MIAAAVRAAGARIERARSCLVKHGEVVNGGLALPPQPTGPSGELMTGGAEIAYYTDAARAARLAPDVARNLTRFREVGHYAELQRDGAQNIVWFASPSGGLRTTVLACAAG